MRYRFHPAARTELQEAVAYYESVERGLGRAFLEQVHAAVRRAVDYPQAWPRLSARTRRCVTARFPYGVVYQDRGDHIYVLAVAHLHRRPDYWQDRK